MTVTAALGTIRRYDELMAEAGLTDEQPTIAALAAAGYSIVRDVDGSFVWLLHDEVWGDADTEPVAWAAAASHWIDAQPEDCPKCGTQAACNECRGGVG